MKCPRCHKKQEEEGIFCAYCGSALYGAEGTKKKGKKPVAVIAAIAASVAAIVFFVAAIRILGATDDQKFQRALEKGEKYLNELNYEMAVAAYSKAVEIEPRNVEAVCGLAQAYAGLEEYEQAEKVLLSLIETLEQGQYKKQQEELYSVLAGIYIESGDPDKAWSAIQRGMNRAAQADALLNSSDPMKRDTDGDGLFDGTELQNGFDPELEDTDDNGVLDGKEPFARIVSMPSALPREDAVYPVVWAEGKGEVYGDFDAVYLRNNATLKGIGSVVGTPCEFSGQSDIGQAKIGFGVPAAMASGFSENIQVAGYDYKENRLILCDTSMQYGDDGSLYILSDTAEAGTYMLLDWERLKKDTDALEYSSIIEAGKADVVFVIDTTGSMSSPIRNVRENIVAFSQYLEELGVDVRVGIVEYKDIYDDGSGSTVDHGFYYDMDEFKRVLGNFYVDGGGDDLETAVDALDVMSKADFRSGVSRFAILVTDTGYKNGIQSDRSYTMEQMTEVLVSQNICTSVVTYTGSFYAYNDLVSATGGELCDIRSDFSAALQTLMDKMGTMVHEGTWVRLTNGSIVCLQADPTLKDAKTDTDGDGIPDLKEMGELVTVSYRNSLSGEEVSFEAYTFTSNPALADSDGDGLDDGADEHPVRCDVTSGTLDDFKAYFLVDTEDGNTSFGVSEELAQNSGMAALENMLLYLQKRMEYYGLAGFDRRRESYTLYEAQSLAANLQDFLSGQDFFTMETELDLDEVFKDSKKLLKVIKKLKKKVAIEEDGYIQSGDMKQCMAACLGGSALSSYCMLFNLYSDGEIYQRICLDIERGYPVMLQAGLAGNMDLYDNPDIRGRAAARIGSMEWVVLTGYEQNGFEGKVVMEVLYKGKVYYLDFGQFMGTDALLGGIVGVE